MHDSVCIYVLNFKERLAIVLLQVILDEPGVKEEPQELEGEDEVTETKEIFESHHFESMAEGDSQSDQGPGFDPQMLAASQPQSVEDLVAQAIPGSSGLQGVIICNCLEFTENGKISSYHLSSYHPSPFPFHKYY